MVNKKTVKTVNTENDNIVPESEVVSDVEFYDYDASSEDGPEYDDGPGYDDAPELEEEVASEIKKGKVPKAAKPVKNVKEAKAAKQPKEPKAPKEPKVPKAPKEPKVPKNAKQPKAKQSESKSVGSGRRASDSHRKSGVIDSHGQVIGMSMVMLGFVLAAVVGSITGEAYIPENLIMTIVMALCVVLATLSYQTIAVVIGAISVVLFVAYKVFSQMALGGEILISSFLWVVLPAISVGGIMIYLNSNSTLAIENALLKQQISELITMDPITGLYNLRSMFTDIQTQISYSERNKIPFSLMIIRLRYPIEMKRVLNETEFETVIKQLSLLLVDTVRLEDKVYCIDEMGGFGIILTCDREGTKIVENRLRKKLADPSWFSNVSEKNQIRAEVKVGYCQYDSSKFQRDANGFKESVEEEVEYDI